MSGGQRPSVAALVAAHNAEGFIGETLAALAEQSYPHLSVIVSDDASTDDTAELCERFAAADPRFIVVRQPRNLGWIANTNALLDMALKSGSVDCIVQAFHDDPLGPSYIERCVEALERNPDAVIAYTDMALVWPDGHVDQIRCTELDGIRNTTARLRLVARQDGDWWTPLRGVIRADVLRRVGGLRRHRAGEFGADWPWLLSIASLGPFVRVPEILGTKVYRAQSVSRQWNHFSIRLWIVVTGAAMQAIWRSPIQAHQKLALLWPVTRLLRVRTPLRVAAYARAARVRLSGERDTPRRG